MSKTMTYWWGELLRGIGMQRKVAEAGVIVLPVAAPHKAKLIKPPKAPKHRPKAKPKRKRRN